MGDSSKIFEHLEKEGEFKNKKIRKDKCLEALLYQKRTKGFHGINDKLTNFKELKSIYDKEGVNPSQQYGNNNLYCPICYDYYINPKTTVCGHTFCDRCIFQYILNKSVCPICRKMIKKHPLCSSIILEEVVNRFVKTQETQIIDSFEKRKIEYKQWIEEKTVKSFYKGMKLDVRDTENIWCLGTIKEITNNRNHSDTLFIHYEKWNKIYDEFICSNSIRLAPAGFFTNRKDIPRYSIGPEDNDLYLSYLAYSGEDQPLRNRGGIGRTIILDAIFNPALYETHFGRQLLLLRNNQNQPDVDQNQNQEDNDRNLR